MAWYTAPETQSEQAVTSLSTITLSHKSTADPLTLAGITPGSLAPLELRDGSRTARGAHLPADCSARGSRYRSDHWRTQRRMVLATAQVAVAAVGDAGIK